MHSILVAGALVCCYAGAGPGPHGPGNWSELEGKSCGLGLPREHVDQTIGACRRRGMSVQEADNLLCPVYSAKAENLPVGCIYEKIDEGLAKQVGASNIVLAAQNRLDCMRQAKAMVAEIMGGPPDGHGNGPAMLIENTGMALESGLDPAVVKTVFYHNGHRQLGRLAHVMEAAETLHLEGIKDENVQRILTDFLDRHLNRHEMFRAVGVLKDGLASGQDFESVYAKLWISSN